MMGRLRSRSDLVTDEKNYDELGDEWRKMGIWREVTG